MPFLYHQLSTRTRRLSSINVSYILLQSRQTLARTALRTLSRYDSMTDTAAEAHSATSSEATDGAKDNKDTNVPTICEAFSSPAGNVFFKSPDNVIFRVEDFYLKANRYVVAAQSLTPRTYC
jgi:hypothetical protein